LLGVQLYLLQNTPLVYSNQEDGWVGVFFTKVSQISRFVRNVRVV
jgi:hypothetical protein